MNYHRLSKFYIETISKRKKGLWASFIRACLYLLSLLYALIVFIRKKCLPTGYRSSLFTISIGNLSAGGTGKTPFTIFLADLLLKNRPVAIVLRGYKAEAEKIATPLLVQKEDLAAKVGDEAALIARRVEDAKVVTCRQKVAGVKLAETLDVACVLVDDGMQHLQLVRDLEIVLIDSQNPFGYGHLLPRGLLREPISALSRADLVVITCRNAKPVPHQIEEVIRSYTRAPIVKVAFQIQGIYDLEDKPIALSIGAKVGLFCAIAKPEQFVASVQGCGLEVVSEVYFTDHEVLDEQKLVTLAKRAKSQGAVALICTEKDRVKCCQRYNLTLPIYWLKIGIQVLSEDEWQSFFQQNLTNSFLNHPF